MTRILNALTDAINDKKVRLPKYLVVIMDKDVLGDIPDIFDDDVMTTTQEITSYMVRKIAVTLRRKRSDLLEKKPGAVEHLNTKIIFVRMLRRIGSYGSDSELSELLSLRARFNDTLNDTAAKMDQYMLTINSCNAYEHFNKHANLSLKGKAEFWLELDGPLERFNINKIRLLPNPKNPPRTRVAAPAIPMDNLHSAPKQSKNPTERRDRHDSTSYYTLPWSGNQKNSDQNRSQIAYNTAPSHKDLPRFTESKRKLPTPPPARRY